MLATAFVLGFHGCDEEIGEAILDGRQEMEVSRNDHDWLGHGAYFWENGERRALEWAAFIKGRPQTALHKVKNPFVIGAVIEVGKCLDLSNGECLADIRGAYHKLEEVWIQAADIARPENSQAHSGDEDLVKRHLDCAVITALHRLRENGGQPPYDTVRGTFPEGGPLYPGAKIMKKTHVQISVRNPAKSILGYFRPRGTTRSPVFFNPGSGKSPVVPPPAGSPG